MKEYTFLADNDSKHLDNRWCYWQNYSNNDDIVCTAHFYKNRIFKCPYLNLDKRLQAEYPCSDYKQFNEYN